MDFEALLHRKDVLGGFALATAFLFVVAVLYSLCDLANCRLERMKLRRAAALADYAEVVAIANASYITLEEAATICRKLREIKAQYGRTYSVRVLIEAETPTSITLTA